MESIAKSGSMSSDAAVRGRLDRRLRELLDRTGRIEADRRRPANPDWTERATELENDEVLAHLDALERIEVREIRDALARLDAGSYGVCRSCGERIPDERLRALPFTPTCVDCA
jgi:RNA polymerase-binding transcription factor DksA